MKMKHCIITILLIVVIASSALSKFVSVTWNPVDKHYQLYDHIVQDAVAKANFSDEISTNGWSFLRIKTSPNYPDQVQAYAAGLAEGYLTRDRVIQQWHNLAGNYCDNEGIFCSKLKDFLDANMEYMNAQIKAKRANNSYFHHVALVLEQQSGIEDGLRNVSREPSTWLDSMGIMFLNLFGDMLDLENKFKKKILTFPFGFAPCSAFIKVTGNNKDLYFGHDSWYLYSSMLRILKEYDFSFRTGMQDKSIIPGRKMTFSSRPGTIPSLDDFYLISSGLAVTETSNENFNSSLWQYVTPEETILTWIRSMVACRLAKTGNEWTEIFSQMNSGTYNNQWMIVNYNKFKSGQPLQDGLLWIIEQFPGGFREKDVTDYLRNRTYWSSYNIPYFEDVYLITNYDEQAVKYGDFFSYERAPRALIFNRDEVKVHDIPSMIKLMRYNDYTRDPFSRCNCTPPYSANNAISARGDLNPKNGTYPLKGLGHGAFGAVDMKITTSTLFKKLKMIAINGPTYNPLPPFQWSASDFNETTKHLGHPDLWNFDPVLWP